MAKKTTTMNNVHDDTKISRRKEIFEWQESHQQAEEMAKLLLTNNIRKVEKQLHVMWKKREKTEKYSRANYEVGKCRCKGHTSRKPT